MNQDRLPASGKKPLIILGAIVVVLLSLIAWSLGRIGFFGDPVVITKGVLGTELTTASEPASVGDEAEAGLRQLCLWFEYDKARDEDGLKVTWYYDGTLVYSATTELTTSKGVRAFYFIKENGKPLPVGEYKAVISSPSKVLFEKQVKIIQKPKPREVEKSWQSEEQKKVSTPQEQQQKVSPQKTMRQSKSSPQRKREGVRRNQQQRRRTTNKLAQRTRRTK